MEKPVPGEEGQEPRRINWLRISAAVLTSKLFFLASCTGGVILGGSFDGIESGTHGDTVHPLDARMAIIALVPDADRTGASKVMRTSLGGLERFKQDNPEYSFMPRPGKGALPDPLAILIRTEYAVTAAGPGKVAVETRFHDDTHHVLARYTATDREIEPLYTMSRYDPDSFLAGISVGIPLAFALALTGFFFKRRLRRATEGSTAKVER